MIGRCATLGCVLIIYDIYIYIYYHIVHDIAYTIKREQPERPISKRVLMICSFNMFNEYLYAR
jgi:hypothetical protein